MRQAQASEQTHLTAVTWRSLALAFVRYGIGGAMIFVGIVLLIAVPGDVGAYGFASAVGAGSSVLLLNFLYRMSVSGEHDREREEQARRYFDEHGEWPEDEEPKTQTRTWILPAGAVTFEQEQRERQAHARATDLSASSTV